VVGRENDSTTNCPGLMGGDGRPDFFLYAGVVLSHPPGLVHRFTSVISVFLSIVIVRWRPSVIDPRRFTLRWPRRNGDGPVRELETGLGSRPHKFESHILRHRDHAPTLKAQ
jgi:hypothetical protein